VSERFVRWRGRLRSDAEPGTTAHARAVVFLFLAHAEPDPARNCSGTLTNAVANRPPDVVMHRPTPHDSMQTV
jgi:hypothetical protein